MRSDFSFSHHANADSSRQYQVFLDSTLREKNIYSMGTNQGVSRKYVFLLFEKYFIFL